MSWRTFYNQFIEALGRTTENMHIEVKVHPQPDGGAILEAIITDAHGRVSKQELQVSMRDRQKFGDTFLIEGFKADIRAGSTPRFRQPSSYRSKETPHLEIDTTDPQFLKNLEESSIKGLRISRRIHASADIDTTHKTLLSIEFDGADAARLFGEWLYDRVIKKTPYKIIVDQIDVSNNADQISAIINNHIQNRYSDMTEQ